MVSPTPTRFPCIAPLKTSELFGRSPTPVKDPQWPCLVRVRVGARLRVMVVVRVGVGVRVRVRVGARVRVGVRVRAPLAVPGAPRCAGGVGQREAREGGERLRRGGAGRGVDARVEACARVRDGRWSAVVSDGSLEP